MRSSVCVLFSAGLLLSATCAQAAGIIVLASGAGSLPTSAENLTGTEVGEIQGSLNGSESGFHSAR